MPCVMPLASVWRKPHDPTRSLEFFYLLGNGTVQVVDLVNDEHALAAGFEGVAHDLLGVTVLVAGGGVDHVETGVEGAADRGDALVEWDVTISEVADAENCGSEARAPELAARFEPMPTHARQSTLPVSHYKRAGRLPPTMAARQPKKKVSIKHEGVLRGPTLVNKAPISNAGPASGTGA